MTASLRRDLGDVLLEERLLTEGVLRAVRRLAKRERMSIVVVLLEEEHVSEDQLLSVLSRRLKLPVVTPGNLLIEEEVLRLIPYDLAERYRVLPLGLHLDQPGGTGVLRVAMADPLDREARDDLQRLTGHSIDPVISPASALAMAIRQRYRGALTQLPSSLAGQGRGQGQGQGQGQGTNQRTPPAGVPIVRGPSGGLRKPADMVTQPLTRIDDDAPIELRLRALVTTLVDAGVITEQAYAEAIQRLIRVPTQ